jgi:hypothetical protein
MKTFKILTIIILSSLVLGSCLVDQTDYMDKNDQGPNLYGFLNASMNATITADGNTKDISIPISVYGPTSNEITSDITTSVVVDHSSTAIEGVHYEFATSSVTFSPSNSLFTNLEITLLSEGIDAPAEFHLVLKLGESSDPNVKASGKKGSIDIAIKYLCFSNLAGNYTNPDAPECNQSDPVTLTLLSAGRYYVSSMTGYNWTSGNCIGYNIIDNCGDLYYDGGDLEDNGYSGGPTDDVRGHVNEDGSFTFKCMLVETDYEATSTYTPVTK